MLRASSTTTTFFPFATLNINVIASIRLSGTIRAGYVATMSAYGIVWVASMFKLVGFSALGTTDFVSFDKVKIASHSDQVNMSNLIILVLEFLQETGLK